MIAKIFLGVLIGGSIGTVLGYFDKCSSGSCPLTANPYRGAIYGAVMGALLVSVLSQTPKNAEENSNIVHINSEPDFKAQVLDASGIFLVDLFSNRCPPCRVLAPTISSLADRDGGKSAHSNSGGGRGIKPAEGSSFAVASTDCSRFTKSSLVKAIKATSNHRRTTILNDAPRP